MLYAFLMEGRIEHAAAFLSTSTWHGFHDDKIMCNNNTDTNTTTTPT